MDVSQILDELEAREIRVKIKGQGLELEGPKGALSPDLVDEIRRHKPELVKMLSLLGWPEASRDCVRRFGAPEARLYPFLSKTVTTPQGPGRLVGVLPDRATVALEGKSGRVVHLLPSEVGPPDLAADFEHPFETVN